MGLLPTLTDFSDGNVLTAAQLESDSGTIRTYFNTYAVLTDVARTITAIMTFSAVPVFSVGITVSASGITVTGNSTITGTLTGLTGVTSSGTAALAVVTVSSTLNVTGTSTLGATNTAALTSTTFAPTGLAQGPIAALTRYSGGDAGATPAINWNNGNKQRFRLTANATPTFANPVKGADYELELQQDGTGSRTVTWSGATIVWPDGVTPTLTTTANRKDVILLQCVDAASSGTYLGFVMGQNFNNTTA
jgi:hypothetical protein